MLFLQQLCAILGAGQQTNVAMCAILEFEVVLRHCHCASMPGRRLVSVLRVGALRMAYGSSYRYYAEALVALEVCASLQWRPPKTVSVAFLTAIFHFQARLNQ